MGRGKEAPSSLMMYLHIQWCVRLLRPMISNHAPLINECQRREIWPKWKDAIQVKMDSLTKRKVFETVMPTPPNIKPID